MDNSKAEAIRDSAIQVLRNTIKRIIPSDSPVPSEEVDALTQLCVMSMIPTGEEDPKVLIRTISKSIIDHLMSEFDQLKVDPVIGKIAQFFLIEWCYRNDHFQAQSPSK